MQCNTIVITVKQCTVVSRVITKRTALTKTNKLIPYIVATDQYGAAAAYDVMVTRPVGGTAASNKPLHAATKGKNSKQAGYDEHKAKCAARKDSLTSA